MRCLLPLLGALLPALAAASPFASGDPRAGSTLHQQHCVACHVQLAGGDGSAIYTRPERKIHSAQQLAARIAACNSNTAAGWFPDEERHVGAYLNRTFYKFK